MYPGLCCRAESDQPRRYLWHVHTRDCVYMSLAGWMDRKDVQPHVIQLRAPGPDSALQSTHCIFLFAVCRRQRGAAVTVLAFDTVRVRAGVQELVSALG